MVFESIDDNSICKAFLKTTGGAGPSGTDAAFWKRLCTSFVHASNDLCASLALLAKKISTTYVDPEGLSCLTTSRLIALDKMPGVRPIGIGEVVTRAISKAIVGAIQDENKQTAGCSQLCAGMEAGCEVGVHAMRKSFGNPSCEAVLFADATNAFNCLNRRAALINIQALCPARDYSAYCRASERCFSVGGVRCVPSLQPHVRIGGALDKHQCFFYFPVVQGC